MERKHKRCCFKRSDSICRMREMRAMSRSSTSAENRSQHTDSRNSIPAAGKASSSSVSQMTKDSPKKRFLSFLWRRKESKELRKQRKSLKQAKIKRLKTNPSIPMEEQDIRKLIRLYCKHDNLYNPKNSYYGNKEIDEDCYIDMTRSFPGHTSNDLRGYLEELKNLFEREYTIIESACRNYGDIMTPSIQYYNEFLFLVPYLCINFDKKRPRSSSDMGLPKSSSPHMSSSSSSMISHKKPSTTDLKNTLAANEMLRSKMANLAASPFSPCGCFPKCKRRKTEKKPSERSLKKEKEKKQKGKQEDAKKKGEQQAPDGSVVDADGQVTFSPSTQKRNSPPKPLQVTQNQPQKVPESKMSFESSYYSTENEKEVTDLSRRSSTNPPAPPDQDVRQERRPSGPRACPRDVPCPLAAPQAQTSSSPTEPACGNAQQVQMLCDMIRTELTCAPDFIYFDAKWRIIEILREVHKRQLVHLKGTPIGNGPRSSQSPPPQPLKNIPASQSAPRRASAVPGQKGGAARPCACQFCRRPAN